MYNMNVQGFVPLIASATLFIFFGLVIVIAIAGRNDKHMNWFKIIFMAALSVIFVVGTFVALFGAGQALNATLRTYVFQVEDCRFGVVKPLTTVPAEGESRVLAEELEETCDVDYNQAKRNIVDGLSMFILAAPLAGGMFWQARRMMKEGT